MMIDKTSVITYSWVTESALRGGGRVSTLKKPYLKASLELCYDMESSAQHAQTALTRSLQKR